MSKLPKTWIFDVDGTIVKHNGYLLDGFDTVLPGVKSFFASLPADDVVIFLTARTEKHLDNLKSFLRINNIRFDYILTNIPVGERILINDEKPSGLKTAYCFNKKRDSALEIAFSISEVL